MKNSSKNSKHLPRSLFDAIYEMNAATNHADFFSAVVAGLTRLIRTDICVLQAFDRTHGRIRLKMNPEQPFTPEEIDYYMAHPNDMPLVTYYERTSDTQARRICDVTDMRAWRQSEYYRFCLARQKAPYSLALPITIDASIVAAVSFNRGGREFTLRDCALLDAFAPHFRLAWSNQSDPWAEETAPASVAAHSNLTKRETDVLYWITQGKLNREIATILDIRLSTVQEHVANILR
ncbi:MAG: LuxR C-terminal-related transcriptional regulator, partial [Chthoniobacterales bacterium]